MSSEFKTYVKSFLKHFSKEDINVANGRKFISHHKFDVKYDKNRNREDILNIINNYLQKSERLVLNGVLQEEITCKNEIVGDISSYFSKIKEEEPERITLSEEEFDDFIDVILEERDNMLEYFETRKENKGVKRLLSVTSRLKFEFGRLPIVRLTLLVSLAKQGYLLANFLETSKKVTILCRTSHNSRINKSTLDLRLKEGEDNACGECNGNNIKNNESTRKRKLQFLERVCKRLNELGCKNEPKIDSEKKEVEIDCPNCGENENIPLDKVKDWKICHKCNDLLKLKRREELKLKRADEKQKKIEAEEKLKLERENLMKIQAEERLKLEKERLKLEAECDANDYGELEESSSSNSSSESDSDSELEIELSLSSESENDEHEPKIKKEIDLELCNFVAPFVNRTNFDIPRLESWRLHKLYSDGNKNKILDELVYMTDYEFPTPKFDLGLMEGDYVSLNKLPNEISYVKNGSRVVVSNNVGKEILNYFTQDLVLGIKVKNTNIYLEWKNENSRRVIWDKLLENDRPINVKKIINVYSKTGARGYNFPPNVAASVYKHFKSKHILDFCSGFASRMLGFWVSDAISYTGIDPNKKINYLGLRDYLLEKDVRMGLSEKRGCKRIKIINEPAEDLDFTKIGDDGKLKRFDTIFTSPPYYDLEIYSDDETQSCAKYTKYKIWLNKFLLTVISKSIQVLSKEGYLLINIKNSKKYKIADDMVRYILENYCEGESPRLIREDDIYFQTTSKSMLNAKCNVVKPNETIFVFRKIV
jgi:tRNA1(Val) A37 N6-methylase TrmN6